LPIFANPQILHFVVKKQKGIHLHTVLTHTLPVKQAKQVCVCTLNTIHFYIKLMKLNTVLLFLCLISAKAIAQTYSISGTVTDASTGEHLISASIYNQKNFEGTVSNYYGYYTLKQEKGEVVFTCSYLGYETFTKTIDLKEDIRLNIALEPNLTLEEITVESSAPINNVRNTQTSMVELPVKSLKSLPVLLGETDVIKGLQLMPGIQGGTEGTSGLYVRGGSADQNLILLDGVPVYNVNHLFGIFSVFNGDALNSVTMYKGGFPARFGGRLSSVVDIRMKEGNNEKVKGELTIGLLASKLSVDGPINDKTTFFLSGRRTYFDLFTYPIQIIASSAMEDTRIWGGYYFYDMNAKVSHRYNENNRFYVSCYSGSDRFFMRDSYKYDEWGSTSSYKDKVGLNWGNITSSARWNHIFRSDLFSNATLTYTRFKFKVFEDYQSEYSSIEEKSTNNYYYEYFSQIQDLSLNHDIDYILNTKNYVRFGYSGTMHLFSPGIFAMKDEYYYEGGSEVNDTASGAKDMPSIEAHAYIEDDFSVGSKLKFNCGLHYSAFGVENNFFQSLEPRISARLLVSPDLSFKVSYVSMKQYLMLLTSNSLSLPTDLWIPVSGDLKPQKSWQTAGGLTYSLKNKYLFSLEGFYKEMFNVTEYKEGAGIFNMQGEFDQALTQGYGDSYGMEMYIRKNSGKTTGWISYTLSWANRHFSQVSDGQIYPYKYDRRHQLNIVINHKISDKWDFGTSWIFGTGYPFTMGKDKFVDINKLMQTYNPSYYQSDFQEAVDVRNNFRMPNYHRLDINFNKKKIKKQRERTWSYGIYNTYAHRNPFLILKSYNDRTGKTELKQLSILVFVPYIRWSINLNKLDK